MASTEDDLLGDQMQLEYAAQTRYRLIYELVSDDELEVFAVIHGARSLDL